MFLLPSRVCRFPKTKGVAGYVATSGETLNINDAYHDERFNRSERNSILQYAMPSIAYIIAQIT